YGLIGSVLLHILVFGMVIFNFTSGGKDEAPPPVPVAVEIMSPKDYSERQAGKTDGKADKPAKTAPAVEKPKLVVKKDPAPKPAPKPKVAEAKPAPERPFDPNRIGSLLKKDAPRDARPQTSQSTMEAPPSKVYSDRQTAVLNRDPNAGAPSGDYEPGRPWRPASSLQDQAMGVPQAHGAKNAGTCADLV